MYPNPAGLRLHRRPFTSQPTRGTGGVRLLAQWNLFASALPLRNAHCLPGAAHTLQSVGERLYKLL